jgi:hypothetical protein
VRKTVEVCYSTVELDAAGNTSSTIFTLKELFNSVTPETTLAKIQKQGTLIIGSVDFDCTGLNSQCDTSISLLNFGQLDHVVERFEFMN